MARRQDQEKRKRILASAYTTFGQQGYRNTTIKEIADSADVAAGSIYTYFTDKETLFRATVQEGWNLFIEELEAISEDTGNLDEKLEIFLELGFSRLKDAYPLLHGMFPQANIMQLFRSNLDRLGDCIQRVFTTGEYGRQDPDRDAEAFSVQLMLSGILFTTAMALPEELDMELQRLKEGIRTQFLARNRVPV